MNDIVSVILVRCGVRDIAYMVVNIGVVLFVYIFSHFLAAVLAVAQLGHVVVVMLDLVVGAIIAAVVAIGLLLDVEHLSALLLLLLLASKHHCRC